MPQPESLPAKSCANPGLPGGQTVPHHGCRKVRYGLLRIVLRCGMLDFKISNTPHFEIEPYVKSECNIAAHISMSY